LAKRGKRVLLIDSDPQGSVAVSLGLKATRGLYQILVLGAKPESCVVEARPGLDVITANRTLAAAEIYLAGRPERHRVMHDRLARLGGYDVTIVDCSPSVGLIAQNALRFVDGMLVPVACEYLGLVGLDLALKALAEHERITGHGVQVAGVLPTFLDRRLNVCSEAMDWLRSLHEKELLPPIRISSKIKESPARGATVFEHAPRSKGARDYEALAEWFTNRYLSNGGAVPREAPNEAITVPVPSSVSARPDLVGM
jgi:chromosome partitioning protein